MVERAFSKIPINQRSAKPRAEGLTEIRGPSTPPIASWPATSRTFSGA